MGLSGNAESSRTLRGKLSGLKTIHGYSAYEVAVINGFSGTVDEWLESLKVKGDPGKPGAVQTVNGIVPDENGNVMVTLGSTAKVSEIDLLASRWVGSASPYSQVVEIDGVTEHSQVDLTPSVEQLVIFHDKDLGFVTENEDGVVTVYAIGQKPSNDYRIQVTITEVKV